MRRSQGPKAWWQDDGKKHPSGIHLCRVGGAEHDSPFPSLTQCINKKVAKLPIIIHDVSLLTAWQYSELRSMHTAGYQVLFLSFITSIYILSRFLGALRIMLSTRNRSCKEVSHTITSFIIRIISPLLLHLQKTPQPASIYSSQSLPAPSCLQCHLQL